MLLLFFFFLVFLSLFVFFILYFSHRYVICMEQEEDLHQWKMSCFSTPSGFVCTVCIFSKAFEADCESIGLLVKEAGLVYLLATRHLCNGRVVCCALVFLKHPIKHTVVGLWDCSPLSLSGSFVGCVRPYVDGRQNHLVLLKDFSLRPTPFHSRLIFSTHTHTLTKFLRTLHWLSYIHSLTPYLNYNCCMPSPILTHNH